MNAQDGLRLRFGVKWKREARNERKEAHASFRVFISSASIHLDVNRARTYIYVTVKSRLVESRSFLRFFLLLPPCTFLEKLVSRSSMRYVSRVATSRIHDLILIPLQLGK